MAFISHEISDVVASFSQSAIRLVEEGDQVEVVFNTLPGQVFSGKVRSITKVSHQAQLAASSALPTMSGAPVNDRWAIRVTLDDEQQAKKLPQGAGGSVAVYTSKGFPVHVISKVTVRINAWLAYLTSP